MQTATNKPIPIFTALVGVDLATITTLEPTPARKVVHAATESPYFTAKIPTEVQAIKSLSAGAKVLFGYLCSLAHNPYKTAFCSNAHLAAVFGRTERTIQRWLRALVKHRLIKRNFKKLAPRNSLRTIRILFKQHYKSYTLIKWTAKTQRNFTIALTLGYLQTQTRRHQSVERIPYLHTSRQIAHAIGTPLSTIHAVLHKARADGLVLVKTRKLDKARGWYKQQLLYTAKAA